MPRSNVGTPSVIPRSSAGRRIGLRGSVPVRVSANEAAADEADDGKIDVFALRIVLLDPIGLPPGERRRQRRRLRLMSSYRDATPGSRDGIRILSDAAHRFVHQGLFISGRFSFMDFPTALQAR